MNLKFFSCHAPSAPAGKQNAGPTPLPQITRKRKGGKKNCPSGKHQRLDRLTFLGSAKRNDAHTRRPPPPNVDVGRLMYEYTLPTHGDEGEQIRPRFLRSLHPAQNTFLFRFSARLSVRFRSATTTVSVLRC